MARVKASAIIRAPTDVVFDAITDPRRTTEWNPHILEVSEASPMPLQPGTSWTQVALVAGRKVKLTCKIVRLDPPLEGELKIGGDQQATAYTRCRPEGDGTHVTQTLEFKPPGGMLGRMAGPVMSAALHHELTRALERQRETLEQEAKSA